jgi:hypothetical protein
MPNDPWDFEPQLSGFEGSGKEPSVREMLFRYYTLHDIPTEVANRYVEEYLKKLGDAIRGYERENVEALFAKYSKK